MLRNFVLVYLAETNALITFASTGVRGMKVPARPGTVCVCVCVCARARARAPCWFPARFLMGGVTGGGA